MSMSVAGGACTLRCVAVRCGVGQGTCRKLAHECTYLHPDKDLPAPFPPPGTLGPPRAPAPTPEHAPPPPPYLADKFFLTIRNVGSVTGEVIEGLFAGNPGFLSCNVLPAPHLPARVVFAYYETEVFAQQARTKLQGAKLPDAAMEGLVIDLSKGQHHARDGPDMHPGFGGPPHWQPDFPPPPGRPDFLPPPEWRPVWAGPSEPGRPEQGCFNCGSMEHRIRDCPVFCTRPHCRGSKQYARHTVQECPVRPDHLLPLEPHTDAKSLDRGPRAAPAAASAARAHRRSPSPPVPQQRCAHKRARPSSEEPPLPTTRRAEQPAKTERRVKADVQQPDAGALLAELLSCARQGDLRGVQACLAKGDVGLVQQTDSEGRCVLLTAIQGQHLELVLWLMGHAGARLTGKMLDKLAADTHASSVGT